MTAFRTSRRVPLPPAQIFDAISNPDRLERWWGPAGFTNVFDECEFVPEGRWKFTMYGPNGAQFRNESVFREIVRDERVVIRHISPPKYELTILIRPTPDGSIVSWDQRFEDARVAETVRHIVEPSNEQNLDRLERELGLRA